MTVIVIVAPLCDGDRSGPPVELEDTALWRSAWLRSQYWDKWSRLYESWLAHGRCKLVLAVRPVST